MGVFGGRERTKKTLGWFELEDALLSSNLVDGDVIHLEQTREGFGVGIEFNVLLWSCLF